MAGPNTPWINTIDHTKVPSNQTAFPVLVAGRYTFLKSVANGGLVTNASGFDINPYAESARTTLFSWERIMWNGATGDFAGVVWINLSSSVDAVIYWDVGNTSVTTDLSAQAWDSNTQLVQIFPDGTTLSVVDGKGTNSGTNHGATATTGAPSIGAALFNGSSQWVESTTTNIPTWNATGTWLATVRYDGGLVSNGDFIICGSWFDSVNGQVLFGLTNISGSVFAYSTDGANAYTNSTPITLGTWHRIGFQQNRPTLGHTITFLDGVVTNTLAGPNGVTGASAVVNIGQKGNNTGWWNGAISAFIVSDIVRSADYMTTDTNSWLSPSTFYSSTSPLAGTNTGFFHV